MSLLSRIEALGSPYVALGALIFALSMSVTSAWLGYKYADNRCKADRAELAEQFQQSVIELDAKLRAAEMELLERSSERQVIVEEVIKHVPTYINVGACRITPAGVQHIRDAARSAFTVTERIRDGAGPTAEVP